MAGLLVDVYGLDELRPSAARVSCLWLHHPRTRSKEHMADIAARCVGAWNARRDGADADAAAAVGGRERERGLLALAYDQRNHGSRLVDERANASWREGNAMHAVDMFGVVQGMVADQRVLLDLVEGYLFPNAEGKRKIDQHLALGVSLGGHSVWQLMFAEPRVEAGVVVIGCPDYINLLSDRARLSKLSTYSVQDNGASFLGSKDFPQSLVAACAKYDPKAIFFGASAVPGAEASGAADEAARKIVRERLRGKKFLLCSGGDDKLVPYRCSEPFLRWFKQATESWFKEENVSVDDRVYPGVGHSFSADMISDSVRFVVDAVAGADKEVAVGNIDEQRASKI
ncbi:f4e52abc-21a6-40c0-ac21-bd6b0bb40383 [Thermothielavioides terrestris]|uniref:F4e52abc-21a6-40c0-ac21-bd6b0bb40383 n=1 Tax=Thermothielavioides terrestris TaxID=2587410 RepID=A0A3S4C5M1_9PEZI|nr:f4e52abc-21a6-40c0-ac21-bd6b0bb40383 [Thermothielavioides terrestris]